MDRIILEGLGKRYGKQWALRGVNARLVEGEVVMVIGPNGSGKTTLIKCLLGLVKATEGAIVVNGKGTGNDPSYRAALGYMPQFADFPRELTVDQLLRMMNDIRDARSGSVDDRLIGTLGVDALLDKRISALSGGMRQKVSAVLAFRYRPDILVLDEIGKNISGAGMDTISYVLAMEEISKVDASVSVCMSVNNSLVGSSTRDTVGSGGITVLSNGNYLVNSGVEISDVVDGLGSIDFSGNQFTVSFSHSGSFSPTEFNGFVISDLAANINPFTAFTLISNTGVSGTPVLSFDSNHLYVNWEGLNYTRGDLVFSVESAIPNPISTFSPTISPVPEPDTYAILLVGLGLVGYSARRKQI